MSEKHTDQGPDDEERSRRKNAKSLLENPVERIVFGSLWWLVFTVMPKKRKHIDTLVGLFQDSIIGPSILHPTHDGGVHYATGNNAEVRAFDFHRPDRLPIPGSTHRNQLFTGSIFAAMLDEIKGKPAHEETPLSLLRISKIDHALSYGRPSLSELIKEEMLVPTTQADAYKQVGLYERYADDLHSRQIADDLVHQVTPKGNSLVFVHPVGGAPKPAPDAQLKLLPAWAPKLA